MAKSYLNTYSSQLGLSKIPPTTESLVSLCSVRQTMVLVEWSGEDGTSGVGEDGTSGVGEDGTSGVE